MFIYDTETCGLYGPAVLIQYAIDDGPITLHNIWKTPAIETIRLIEEMMDSEVCGFNLTFDHFQLCKIYNMLIQLKDLDVEPQDVIADLANHEKTARDGKCLRPKAALDLMLHARKGEFQSTMNRKPIRIRRIPTVLAESLADKLEELIPFPDIYFARRKVQGRKWRIVDTDDPTFKDLELKFNPSTALKALAVHIGLVDADEVLTYGEAGVDDTWKPKEDSYVPYGSNWPEVIRHHYNYWEYNSIGRKYAEDDVRYTRGIWEYFGRPKPGDIDSELACMVAAIRWKGYIIDVDAISDLANQAREMAKKVPTAPNMARKYLAQYMSDTEQMVLEDTKKVTLQEIAKWENHPAAKAAQEIIDAREASKELELYEKLVRAERLHAGFKVIGTKSARMSGSDGLNPQGIKKDKKVRKCFTLAHEGMVLCGGDFDSFEVSLMEAVWHDHKLRAQLLSGKKLHALLAMKLYPNSTYEEIMEEEKAGTFNNKYVNGSRYKDGKQAVFGLSYGGTDYTLETKLGIPHEVAVRAFEDFAEEYPGVAAARKNIFDKFCSMRQPGGIGTEVIWHEPADYIESIYGFRRYFTLENKVCKALFDLAQKPPKEWRAYKMKVVRRDRAQTVSGALQSALYGAAFQIQAANMRAANNHIIQSPGATLTKELQYELWKLQPKGICNWVIMPMNIHDEIMSPVLKDSAGRCAEIVGQFVEKHRERVPLLSISWKTNMENWSAK